MLGHFFHLLLDAEEPEVEPPVVITPVVLESGGGGARGAAAAGEAALRRWRATQAAKIERLQIEEEEAVAFVVAFVVSGAL